MKKLFFISLLLISASAHSQLNWSDYATSFGKTDNGPSLGVAIPYNGIYDNFDRNIVGISHWNAQYQLGIDTTLDDQIPLYFVYDTAGVWFLLPHINREHAGDVEYTVLLNNKTTITPWSHITQYTQEGVGQMKAGSGIAGPYHAAVGQYLVAHVRNKDGQIISSRVIYFKQKAPEIKSLSTSDNSDAFSNLVKNEDPFAGQLPDLGWHRQYTRSLSGKGGLLKLSHNENNLLIDINARIYRKDALEYALFKDGKEVRTWSANEFNTHYILLKDLDPGDYRVLIRFKRQRSSIAELRFSISTVWYKTFAFRSSMIIMLLLLAVLLIFFTKYRNQRKTLGMLNRKAAQSAEELKHIHALLNPHFTFNALSSIQGLVNKGDVGAASKYLSSFGELLRETLKESKTEHIPLTKELENLEIYISLEQLRYPFTYNLDLDASIDLFSLTIPPFLLQPFVENAIKHGFSKMNGQGALHLHITQQGNNIVIRIADNGPGFDTAAIKEGYGLSLSRKRVELLNRDYGEALISLAQESTAKGTTIVLLFKNWV
ncbi:histidine kinase [uncultured Chitinophaga sp.]|uniref:sensor histidine kinase n=1 Tax=uncultured Chitinophaga sp. TaxID=339340 RepID=UPI00260FF2A3|nr:histidine kinase [uncultured Chitinophaga sp.]